MVTVENQGSAAEGGEVYNGSRYLWTDALEGFEPRADLLGAVVCEEFKCE